ncbi:cation-translocating P-type ATPase [Mesomycoplasma molare]|uniref:Cation-translocating P-type ATPase n=1 Tax=Mesomycoplasma molare TaxID=171288 RepID=A0ABY5TWK3_9BACT|nr:cation-translocating P-type ATPase [Mesomycoplasma molare]UWD33971.1 cation-translocating P-type ATPase [Mesomycoplasma molare]
MEKNSNFLTVDFNKGLNNEEVLENRKEYGENKLREKKKTPLFIKFLKQFIEPMIILLLVASGLSLGIAIYEFIVHGNEHTKIEIITSFMEPFVILFIVILNAIFGLIQENKAEKSIESLRSLSSPTSRVLRNGQEIIILTEEIVVGDIVLIEAGNTIGADGILINSAQLEVEESILTGESLSVFKKNITNETFNWEDNEETNVFAGTNVINGRAKFLVTKTGNNTKLGNIAELLNNEGEKLTPLQSKLSSLSKKIGIFSAFLCVVTFLVYIFVVASGNWNRFAQGIIIAITLAIGTIPEGLVPIVTVILSIGVKRLSSKNALVKKLPAAETLGNVSIICSDKTGTLTQNKMKVVETYIDPLFTEQEFIENFVLCTDATYFKNEKDEIELIGDPTETAIIQYALNKNIFKLKLSNEFERINEIPFDSERKMMTVFIKYNNRIFSITKGAPDSIFRISRNYNQDFENYNLKFSSKALRVLALAIKEWDNIPENLNSENIENNLTLIGLIGMIDPPREEVKTSIEIAKKAGIKTVMITGDYENTAYAIAKELKIVENENDMVLSGRELKIMSDEELDKIIEKVAVFARVSPEDKIRIVKSWQKHNKVVSMTGDGVNDAPALKAADIGCAMGITGTDVSKQAADMVLTDDNFSTIVSAVKEGRKILYNIKRLMIFLFTTNLSALLTTFIGMLIFGINPLSSLQILWINIISETFPGIALGLNRTKQDLMKNKPLEKNASILDKGMMIKILILSLLTTTLSLFSFYLGAASSYGSFSFLGVRDTLQLNNNTLHLASLSCFITMGIILSLNSIVLRSNELLIEQKIKDIKFVFFAFIVSFIILLPVAYIPEFSKIFNMNFYVEKFNNWIPFIPFIFGLIPILSIEIVKSIQILIRKK